MNAPVDTANISYLTPISDELLVNRDHSTGLQKTSDLATQLAGMGKIAEMFSAFSLVTSASVVRTTLAKLQAEPVTNGRTALVLLDPNVALRGIYEGVGGQWVRVADLPADVAVKSAEAALIYRNESEEFRDEARLAAERAEALAGLTAEERAKLVALPTNAALQAALAARISSTEKGAANGVSTLDSSGKVPAIQLPSFVDDVLEYATVAGFPTVGETGKIYVATSTNLTYRWSGTTYVEIASSPGSTDAVPEGSSRLYFTVQRVRDVVLTGLATATNAAVVATDNMLSAIGKLQAQITGLASAKLDKAGGFVTGLLSVGGNGQAGSVLAVNGAASSERRLELTSDSVRRFSLRLTSAGNFAITRYDETGAVLTNPLAVFANGDISYDRVPTVNGSLLALRDDTFLKSGGIISGNVQINTPGYGGFIISGFNSISANSGDQFRLMPTDFGEGKPFFVIAKSPVANEYSMGLWDGVTGNGVIRAGATWRFATRPNVNGTNVALMTDITSGVAGVATFKNRSGAVVPAAGDYTSDQIGYGGITVETELKRLYISTPWVSVEQYGAVGDNSADDTAKIQAAIDALPARGGRIIFAAKAYYCAGSLLVKGKVVELVGIPSGGSGSGTMIRFASNKGLRFEQASFSSMKGFTIMGSGGDTSDQLLGIGFEGGNGGCAQMFFEQVNVIGGYRAVWFQNVLSIRFRHCRFVDSLGPYVVLMAAGPDATHGVDNVEFMNCNFGAQNSPANDAVVCLNGKAHGIKFTDCPILFGNHGLLATKGDASWSHPKFVSMTAGGFENGQGNAIRAVYGDDFRFNSMYASTDGSDDGIYMASTFIGRLKIASSTIRGNGRDGIRVVGGRLTAVSNDIINNGFKTTGDGIRLETAAEDFVITGNYIGVGPDGTNNQRSGITLVTDTSSKGMVTGNRFKGNVSSAFRVGAGTTTPTAYASLNSFG